MNMFPGIRQVYGALYRAEMPRDCDTIKNWRDIFGVKNVIALQEGWTELLNGGTLKQSAEARGVRYWKLPWSNLFRPSTDSFLLMTRILLEPERDGKTLVHCKKGHDRTGWFCGLYLYYVGQEGVGDAWEYVCQTLTWHYRYILWRRSGFMAACREIDQWKRNVKTHS